MPNKRCWRWLRSSRIPLPPGSNSISQPREAVDVPNCFGVLLRKSGLNRPPFGPESVSHLNLIGQSFKSFGCFLSSHKDLKDCDAWGRYSSPKAATPDLDVMQMKKTVTAHLQKINIMNYK